MSDASLILSPEDDECYRDVHGNHDVNDGGRFLFL